MLVYSDSLSDLLIDDLLEEQVHLLNKLDELKREKDVIDIAKEKEI
jgi:hypothetical protein